jgi:hypothetical protein
MTWATTVGVDGGQRRARTWVMMWVMMWAMGTFAAMMPATMLAKGMAGTLAGRGGGALGGGRGAGGGGSGDGGGGSCILQGLFVFYCEENFVWYFYDVWGELVRSHLPSYSCHA